MKKLLKNKNIKLLTKIDRILEFKKVKMLDNYLTPEDKKLLSQIEKLKPKFVKNPLNKNPKFCK